LHEKTTAEILRSAQDDSLARFFDTFSPLGLILTYTYRWAPGAHGICASSPKGAS